MKALAANWKLLGPLPFQLWSAMAPVGSRLTVMAKLVSPVAPEAPSETVKTKLSAASAPLPWT